MAIVNFIGNGKKRQKKWLHERNLLKRFLLRISLMANTGVLIYFAYEYGYLTNIIKKVAPILESLIKQLPL